MSRVKITPPIAYVLLCLCALIWGSNITIGRAVHADIPPIALSFWRNFFGLVGLLSFTVPGLIRQWPLIKKHWKMFAVSGMVGFSLFNAIAYTAVHTTTAINAALVMSMTPVIVPVMAYFMVNEAFSRRQAFGVLISFLGVAVILCRGNLDVLMNLRFASGDLIMLGAAICWSLYTVLVKRRPEGIDAFVFITASLCFAVPAILPFYIWETATIQAVPWSGLTIMTLVYIGLFPTMVALLLFNRSVDVIGPNRAGHFQHLVPIAAALLAIIFLGERLEQYHWVGIFIIGSGIWFAQSTRKS
jgi:drug/metabolite transporter (DMT)-like permease